MTHDDYPPNYYTGDMSGTSTFHISSRNVSFWRRLWFVVSCIPRYLISGSVEVP